MKAMMLGAKEAPLLYASRLMRLLKETRTPLKKISDTEVAYFRGCVSLFESLIVGIQAIT